MDACSRARYAAGIAHGADCEAEGRDYAAIEKTVNTRLLVTRDGANGSETLAQAVARLHPLAALGVTWASRGIANAHEAGPLELLGERGPANGTAPPRGSRGRPPSSLGPPGASYGRSNPRPA